MFSSTIEFISARELRMAKNSGRACEDSPRVRMKRNGVMQASARARRQSMVNIMARAPMNMTTQSSAW